MALRGAMGSCASTGAYPCRRVIEHLLHLGPGLLLLLHEGTVYLCHGRLLLQMARRELLLLLRLRLRL